MPVDSERKTYGKRMTMSQLGWLGTQSMRAYGWFMAWLHEPEPELQDWLKDKMPKPVSDLIAKAYRRK